jgi:hypothetical protein
MKPTLVVNGQPKRAGPTIDCGKQLNCELAKTALSITEQHRKDYWHGYSGSNEVSGVMAVRAPSGSTSFSNKDLSSVLGIATRNARGTTSKR